MFNNITIICIGRAVFTNLDTVLIRPSLTLEQTRTKARVYFPGLLVLWVCFLKTCMQLGLLLVHSGFTLGLTGICFWGPFYAPK